MPLYNRKNMPQVNTQNLSKALSMAKSKVKVSKGLFPASKLKESQVELIPNKVKGIAAKYSKPTDMKPLIISKDNYIIDGHHRWAAAIYKFGNDVKIPVHRINLKRDDAIELYISIANQLDEVMGMAARKKMARKSKSKLKRGLKTRIRKMKKKRSNEDLQKAAIRQAKTVLMQKMMKKSPADMSMMDKMKFSKKLKPGKIAKVAKKILPKLKRAEADRVKKMKSNNTQKKFESVNEDINIPINVGDTVLGGKFKNKRIVVKSIGKNEKGDITINNKPLMKYRLLPKLKEESIGGKIECGNCGWNWKVEDGGDDLYICHKCGNDNEAQETHATPSTDNEKTAGLPPIKSDGNGRPSNSGQYSKVIESTINEIPMGDLKQIDTFADKKLNPVDIVLTDKHFFDRLNDPRNDKEISKAELIGFFKRLAKKKKTFLDFLDKYNQVVAVDDRTNLNIPFMKQANKVIAKTVMRKKDFKTQNQKVSI